MSFEQRMAIDAAASERLAFIRRTYLHVAGALLAMAALLAALVNFVPVEVMQRIWTMGAMGPLLIFVGFLAITWMANRMAQSDMSIGAQYVGLALTVAAYSFILWPAVWIVSTFPKYEGILMQAILLTAALAGGLTVSVFVTKKDFTFLGPALTIMSIVALVAILAGYFFGFTLGLFGALAMIALLCGFILYETSLVLYRFNTNQHVAAAVAIFSSVATLFSWIIRALMYSRD
jgi:FtsH-binding integral membrane protein